MAAVFRAWVIMACICIVAVDAGEPKGCFVSYAWGKEAARTFDPDMATNVTMVAGSEEDFAVLRQDGTVFGWGPELVGKDLTGMQGVVQLIPNGFAFAALLADGTVEAFGNSNFGGDTSCDESPCATSRGGQGNGDGNNAAALDGKTFTASDIVSGVKVFAAIDQSADLHTWGYETSGADMTLYGSDITDMSPQLSSVAQVYMNEFAAAALHVDGSVTAWGIADKGGNTDYVSDELYDVIDITYTTSAFCALRKDGVAVTWGSRYTGGPASSFVDLSAVRSVSTTDYAFAFLRIDGTVITYGMNSFNNGAGDNFGGNSDAVAAELTDVVEVYANEYSFAALRSDGRIVAWGDAASGGNFNAQVAPSADAVAAVYTTSRAFAVLLEDGSVRVWGNPDFGGDAGDAADALSGGVETIHATRFAFAAVKESGSVLVTWGDPEGGGDSSQSPVGPGVHRIRSVYSNGVAFVVVACECVPTQVPHSDYSDLAAIAPATFGDTGRINCDEGYSGGGDVACARDGNYNAVTCTANMCEATSQPSSDHADEGSIEGATTDAVTVTCDDGFSMDGVTSAATTCLPSGLFAQLPPCSGNPCAPSSEPNSDRHAAGAIDGTLGAIVAVTCDDGHEGGGDAVCRLDGSFSAALCERLHCAATSVEHSDKKSASAIAAARFGDYAQVTCDTGHVGGGLVYCSAAGEFATEDAACVAEDEDDDNVLNGTGSLGYYFSATCSILQLALTLHHYI